MALPMLNSPLSIFFGAANSFYAVLNLQLLKGLGNLKKGQAGSPQLAHVPIQASQPMVTVLIAARNEEARIRKCLDCLMAQDYPTAKLQVLVVDDRSEDGTNDILRAYAEKFPTRLEWLKISESSPNMSPKKFALSRGLEKARGEIILTTDADCVMSPAWVSVMAGEFSERTGLVLGMTSYYAVSGENLIWGTAALEFFSYGVVAAALIGLGFPVHGNANNIAYRRKVYDESAGFASHGKIVSGDDDFLIQSIDKLGQWQVRYSVHPEGQVQTEPPLSFRQFWEQRKRWASKCSLYQPKQAAFLAAIFGYYASILVLLVAGIFSPRLFILGLMGFVIKTGTDYMVMRRGAEVFAKTKVMRYFPTTCLIHIPLIIAAVLAGSFGGFTWKDQKVKRRI